MSRGSAGTGHKSHQASDADNLQQVPGITSRWQTFLHYTVREAYLYIVKILVCMVQDEPDFQSLIIIDLANVKVKVVKN